MRLFERRETEPEPGESPRYLPPNTTAGDACAWLRRGTHLILLEDDRLVIYAITPGSPLAMMAGVDGERDSSR